MKNILYIIICAFVALTAAADGLPVSRDQLSNNLTSSSSLPKLPDDWKIPFSEKHPFLERLYTPEGYLDSEFGRIVMVDCYGFNWNSANGTATVDVSSRFMYGKSTLLSSQNGNWVVQDLYMDYDIPIDIDENSRKVTLHTGRLLTTYVLDNTTRYNVYAMPEKWLTTLADEYSDIAGQIYRDGSIEFSDGFAFMIEKSILRDSVWETSSWELSPIFRNLHLFVPNGEHTFSSKYVKDKPRPHNGWGGGLTPRPTRPVNPKPVKTTPITPRVFEPKSTLGNPGDATTIFDMSPSSSVPDQEFQVPLSDSKFSTQNSVPVYIYQMDDSTIYVYNLYGTDFNWNRMIINPDGTMTFPTQEVSGDGGKGVYNYSRRDNFLVSDNQGTYNANVISWGDTYFDYEYEGNPVVLSLQLRNNRNSMLDSVYRLNHLSYTKPRNPSFNQPIVTDSTVTFRAETQSSGEVVLLLYDPEQDVYSPVSNPYTVSRTDTAYNVSLVAYSQVMDGEKYTYSGDVYFEYEVPALAQAEEGDVNNDGVVDITDVTSLINRVLDSTDAIDRVLPKHVDANGLEGIDIEDITTLIYRILCSDCPTE